MEPKSTRVNRRRPRAEPKVQRYKAMNVDADDGNDDGDSDGDDPNDSNYDEDEHDPGRNDDDDDDSVKDDHDHDDKDNDLHIASKTITTNQCNDTKVGNRSLALRISRPSPAEIGSSPADIQA